MKIRLATIIDCEGTINIEKGYQGYPRPRVEVSQNDKEYLMRFKRIFGFGCVSKQNRSCWQYSVCYIQALIVCLVLHNEFEIKKEKAKEIIKYYEKKLHGKRGKVLMTNMRKYSLEYKKVDGLEGWSYNGEFFPQSLYRTVSTTL